MRKEREKLSRVFHFTQTINSALVHYFPLSLIWCKRQGFSMTYPPFRSQMLSITRSSKVPFLSENMLGDACGHLD